MGGVHVVITARNARRAALVVLAGLLPVVIVLSLSLTSGRAAGDSPPALPQPEPDLSLPAIPSSGLAQGNNFGGSSFVMLGADAAGEAFAYTVEPSPQAALASVGGQSVPSDWSSGAHFVIYALQSSGWHLTQEALGPDGTPIPSFQPVGYPSGTGIVPAGTVAPGGSAVIAGTDTSGGSAQQVVLVRDPGGEFRAAPAPPSTGTDPVLPTGDSLFDSSNPALAPIDDSGHGGVLVASPQLPLDVLHYDGTTWTQEPIQVPPGGASVQSVLGISATSPSDAYLLATTSTGGIALFKRESTSTAPGWQWVEVHLDGQQGSLYSAGTGSGYSSLGALDPSTAGNAGAQPLTATGDGAWVDGSFTDGQGAVQQFTLDVSVTEESDGPHGTLHTWCNDDATPGLCDEPLPTGLPGSFYRSIAWSGGGPYGSRIITGMPDGAILSLQGTSLTRIAGLGTDPQAETDGSAAFLSPTEGWTGGAPPTHFTMNRSPDPLQAWPAPFRQPLTAIAGEPGKTPGSTDAQAIAVGEDGEVARYTPGQGWAPESLLTPAGIVATPTLRGVAWPEEDYAYAVGDDGQMWRWERSTGLWQKDPATPYNFDGNLTAIAFDPSNSSVGYAVGLDGVLLRYDKTWTQETLPPGLEHANFTSVTFAGSEAIAAFVCADTAAAPCPGYEPGLDSGLLINDGNGWQVDEQEQQITTPPASGSLTYRPVVNVVAGLSDGGAVAAGDGVLLERDSAGAPWRLARDPLPGYPVVAAAAIRDGPVVRALLSVDPIYEESLENWPMPSRVQQEQCAQTNSCVGDEGLPYEFGSYDLPANGWLLQETANGWEDVQHNDYPANYGDTAVDNPRRDDPIQALLIDPDGTQGWAVGGETGIVQNMATGAADTSSSDGASPLHTAGIYRYPATSTPPPGAASSPPPLNPKLLTVAVAGGGACAAECADRDPIVGLGPPTWLDHAVSSASSISSQPGGPRAFIYTGGIVPNALLSASADDPNVADEISYFANHTESAAAGMPFAPVISTSEVLGGAIAPAFMQDFSPIAGVSGDFPDYYAFDVSQPGTSGKLRVVVIDDASTAAAEGLVNPSDPQYQFVTSELASARSSHIPVIVAGSRTLTTQSATADSPATGATAIAQLLVEDGASAYFFESPASNTQYQIPTGAADTIPSYGTGSLSIDAWTNARNQFAESGYLLASIDPTQVDPATDRVPVTVRLIPNIGELSIDAEDGTFLQRSQVALFEALARRPLAGTGLSATGEAVGPDPYIAIPSVPCSYDCAARINPEYSFTSSNPDIADFVEHDPASQNPRAVYLGPDGKPVPDSSSGLMCAYNLGQTTVTITTGGLSYSETITVQGGQVKQPCGTVPLTNPQVKTVIAQPATLPPTNPAPAPSSSAPPPTPAPPPPPAPLPLAPVVAPPPVAPTPSIAHPPAIPFLPRPSSVFAEPALLLTAAPAPAPPSPTGFSGVSVLVTQPVVQEEKKEEHAVEEAQNFSVYQPDDRFPVSPALVIAMAVLAAGAGASLRRRSRPRRRPSPALALTSDRDSARRLGRRGGRRWG